MNKDRKMIEKQEIVNLIYNIMGEYNITIEDLIDRIIEVKRGEK